MVDIHVITDQERLKRIFTELAGIPGVQVRISPSLDTGLVEINRQIPSLQFTQSHMSGLSGEIIIRHIKKDIKNRTTKFILLTEGQENCKGAHRVIDLTLADDLLAAAIRDAVDHYGFKKRKRAPTRKTAAAEPLPETEEDALVDAALDDSRPPFEEAPPAPPVDEFPTAAARFAAPAAPLEFAAELDLLTGTAPFSGPRGDAPAATRHAVSAPFRHLRRIIAVATVAAATAVTVVIINVNSLKKKDAASVRAEPSPKAATPAPTVGPKKEAATVIPPKAPPVPAPAPAVTTPRMTQLPSFIPGERPDKGYAAEHPGWERYRGKNTEFRVFRDNGKIRAVQAIDRRDVNIPEDFLATSLKEMTGATKYLIEARVSNAHYLVEKGRLNADTRVVLYRRLEGSKLKAFVVYFDDGGAPASSAGSLK